MKLALTLSITLVSFQKTEAVEKNSQSWFRPFAWQESPEPGQGSGIEAPPVARNLNIFKWSNDVQPQAQQPSSDTTRTQGTRLPTVQQPSTKLLAGLPSGPSIPADLDAESPVIATDSLQQPGSVAVTASQQFATIAEPQGSASSVSDNVRQTAAYGQQPVNWPAENEQSNQAANSSGNNNPFSWTNSGPAVPQSVAPPQTAPIMERSRQPWEWSNNPTVREKPQEIMPPDEPSLGSALHNALSWSDQPNPTPPTAAESGRPPEDATDAELVEWEKQKYPWIRPFYWANSNPELGVENEIAPRDPTQVEGYVPLLAKPFNWDNRQVSQQPRPLAETPNGLTSYPTTQAAAYFQDEESLPNPLEELKIPRDDEADRNQTAGTAKDNELDGEKKGTLAEAESLGEAPEDNSLQFLRADTVLLKPGDFQFDYGFAYTKFDRTTPVIVATDAGNVVEHAELRLRELRVPFEIRYGLARRVQLFLNVPFGWVNSEFSFPGFDEFENDGGIGDIVFGGSFLLRENDPCNKPDAILTFAAVAPTGNDPFPAVGASTAAPSLGNGFWSLASNLLFIKNYDPVVLFYGAGTRQNFDTEFNGQEFRAGGEYNYQFGVGFGVNSKVTFSTRFNGAYVTESRLDGQRIQGSIQEPMTLGLAMTIAKNKKLIEPFVDFGLTDDASDARFGITWTR